MPEQVTSIRFDSELLARADRLIPKIAAAQAPVRITRADVLRLAITEGLGNLEDTYPEPRRRKA
jgi:hypothetical protein